MQRSLLLFPPASSVALTSLRLKFLALRLGIPDLGMTSMKKAAFKETMGYFPWQHLPTLAPLNSAAFSPNSMFAFSVGKLSRRQISVQWVG